MSHSCKEIVYTCINSLHIEPNRYNPTGFDRYRSIIYWTYNSSIVAQCLLKCFDREIVRWNIVKSWDSKVCLKICGVCLNKKIWETELKGVEIPVKTALGLIRFRFYSDFYWNYGIIKAKRTIERSRRQRDGRRHVVCWRPRVSVFCGILRVRLLVPKQVSNFFESADDKTFQVKLLYTAYYIQ